MCGLETVNFDLIALDQIDLGEELTNVLSLVTLELKNL